MIVLAVDFGASGGKAFAGRFDGRRLDVREVHRFRNDPVRVAGRLHWDILRLLHELKQAIAAARRAGLGEIGSVGICTWGLDFGLLDDRGELAGNPYHYRDEQTRGAMEQALAIVPRAEIFARTGIQFLPMNTLYQLFAMARADAPALERAATLLLIPDLLRYFLSGERASEYTDASTTQFLNIGSGDWDRELLARLDLRGDLLAPIVPPGSAAGRLLPAIADEIGTPRIPVVAVAGHDTASAVAAVPAQPGSEFAYLSCGTWALLGTELERPVLDERALRWNFTNEGGVGGTYRLLKNITGLWLADECRRVWARDGLWDGYDAMAAAVAGAEPLRSLIDPDDPRFVSPADMPGEIAASCRETGQPVPETPGAIMRCLLESLALAYRLTLERTERLCGARFAGLHVVGGGTRNRQLLQCTADAIGRPVWSGPTEATAIGNLLGQLEARGEIAGVAEGRALVRDSFAVTLYEPGASAVWEEAYDRLTASDPVSRVVRQP